MDYSKMCSEMATILPPSLPVSDHFVVGELSCRHCGNIIVSPVLLEMLERLRLAVGAPLRICSGYRCPTHNKAIGGAKTSAHMMGLAADIAVPDRYRMNPAAFLEAAEGIAKQVGGGYHYYPAQWFIHIDCLPWPKDRRW